MLQKLSNTAHTHTQHFFHHHTALDIGSVIQEAYRLQQTTPPELHPDRMLESFVPLTRGTYPVFNKYPKFIVDYQVRERERIRQEELQYLRERYAPAHTHPSVPALSSAWERGYMLKCQIPELVRERL